MKCKIQKYDPAVTEAPFQMIDVETIEMEDPRDEKNMYVYFSTECRNRGYSFKFYTSGDDECDFVVVIYGEFEENENRKLLDFATHS